MVFSSVFLIKLEAEILTLLQLYGGGSGHIGVGKLTVPECGEVRVKLGYGGKERGGDTVVEAGTWSLFFPGGSWGRVRYYWAT